MNAENAWRDKTRVASARRGIAQARATLDVKPYPEHLYPGCPCHACDAPTWTRWITRMSVCPQCGDKRCIGSTDHNNGCQRQAMP